MNNYELLGAIGQGQYGTAYKCRNKSDNQMYCIKKIPMQAKDDQRGALKEASLLASLDHPNVLGYKESFIDKDDALCIITHYCEEGDLFNKIKRQNTGGTYFPETEIMDFFIQIASSLMYIHGKKVLHRDLKTQNIFIARGGIAKLGDFGISKVLEKTADFATTVTGTPYYMAPEICTNQPYTFKSDIWSLGCVLYELCTLKHAFAADSLLSLVYQIVRGNFPPIPSDVFSKGLSDLVNALLVREPNDRPTLRSVFEIPFVQQHIARYHQEEKKRMLAKTDTISLKEQSSTLARRTNQLQNALRDGNGGGGRDEEEGLSTKERLARRKEAESNKRQMELELASLNNQKERGIAAQRKQAEIHSSKIGLAGNGTTNVRPAAHAPNGFQDMYGNEMEDSMSQGADRRRSGTAMGGGGSVATNPWDMNMDTMPSSSSPQPIQRGYDASPQHAAPRGGGDAYNDSMVMYGTMPTQSGGFPIQQQQQPQGGYPIQRDPQQGGHPIQQQGTLPQHQQGTLPQHQQGTNGGGGSPAPGRGSPAPQVGSTPIRSSQASRGSTRQSMNTPPPGAPLTPRTNPPGSPATGVRSSSSQKPPGSPATGVRSSSSQQPPGSPASGMRSSSQQPQQQPRSGGVVGGIYSERHSNSSGLSGLGATNGSGYRDDDVLLGSVQQAGPMGGTNTFGGTLPSAQSVQQRQRPVAASPPPAAHQQQQQQRGATPPSGGPTYRIPVSGGAPTPMDASLGGSVNFGTMNLGQGDVGGGMYGQGLRQSLINGIPSGHTLSHSPRPTSGKPMAHVRSSPAVSNSASLMQQAKAGGGARPSLPDFPTTNSANSSPRASYSSQLPVSASRISVGLSQSSASPTHSQQHTTQQRHTANQQLPQPGQQQQFQLKAHTGFGYHHDEDEHNYDDDFEDYDPVHDQEEVNQRHKILQNVKDMESTFGRSSGGGREEAAMAGVAERIPETAKSSKAKQLEQKCQNALGPAFAEVYKYLRVARSDSHPVQDEKDVQRKLLELVKGDRVRLQGCFLVDQLVFAETMTR